MKQAILYGAGDLRMEDRPLHVESLSPGQVYVETEVTALSTGTDLGNYLGKSTDLPGAPNYPRWVGYSNVGIVKRAGESVRNLRTGQRVFSTRPHQSAYIASDDELIVPVPDGVSPEQAALAQLTQLGVAALRQARYEAGERVAVIGLGVIGLCTVGVARAMGATVSAIANSSLRAKAARDAGAHTAYVTGESTVPSEADVIILTANTWDAYRQAIEIARIGGRISILGFPGRGQPAPDFNPLDAKWIYGKQLTLIGAGSASLTECPRGDIAFNRRRNLEYILGLMSTGALSLEHIISHRIPAHRMKEAYELAREHSKSLVAAIFDWREFQ